MMRTMTILATMSSGVSVSSGSTTDENARNCSSGPIAERSSWGVIPFIKEVCTEGGGGLTQKLSKIGWVNLGRGGSKTPKNFADVLFDEWSLGAF